MNMEQTDPQHYQRLLRVAQRITTQRDVLRLCEVIVEEARVLSGAEGALIYLLANGAGQPVPRLQCAVLRWPATALCQGGNGYAPVMQPELLLDAPASPVAEAARSGEAVTSYQPQQLIGETREATTRDSLAIPLLDHDQQVLGVLQLLNVVESGGATPGGAKSDVAAPVKLGVAKGSTASEAKALLSGITSYAATALHNALLAQELEQLLDAFIRVIARAIDEKSSHTSGHCQRVPLLTELIAQAACADTAVFRDFNLSDDEWYELRVAAWLHDCGKLTTPDSVLDKSTKLHTLHDRIEEVAARYAVLRAVRQGECAAATAAEPEAASRYQRALADDLAVLDDELAFLRRVNKGSECMAEADQARVREIALRQWPDVKGRMQPLLSEEEAAALCVVRGTLTHEEREIINNHVQVTLDMLESLPFPRKLWRVPEYAGGHHERIDGSGFPRGLTGEQMSLPARMLAIADVFEALTAHDRPYKPPMKISQALSILKQMRDARHIDADLYQLFVRERVWETYARRVLDPAQLDVTDASIFL